MYIGIDIGGTLTRVARGEKDKIQERVEFSTKGFEATIDLICDIVKKISTDKTKGIGVSIAGPYDFNKKILLNPPNLPDQESWQNKNLSKIIGERTEIETTASHDASVAALAEYKYGAGQGKNPLLYYTVSTGIGSGLIVNGSVFHGITNPEGGHQILNIKGTPHPGAPAGDLESLSSGSALKRLYNEKPVESEGTPEWYEALHWLSIGITNSILHFSPEVVVIGGGMTKHEQIFFEPLEKYLRTTLTEVPFVPVLPAKLDQDVGLIGAIALAENPLVIK